MNCERCGKRPGEIRYTEVSDGRAQKQLVCAECARELGFDSPEPTTTSPADPESPAGPPPPAKLFGIVSIEATLTGEASPALPADDRRCPECGLTASAFRAQSLFGCPRCYDTFEEGLDPLLKRLHGAVAHRGRVPQGSRVSAEAEPAQLREQLADAMRRQDYVAAARLRDRLRRRERGGPSAAGGSGKRGAP